MLFTCFYVNHLNVVRIPFNIELMLACRDIQWSCSCFSFQIVKENLPIKNSTTKFGNFQAKSSSQGKNAAAGTSAAAPLFDILKRSSAASNVCSRDVLLDLPKPLLADLRVSKRSLKAEGKR